LQAKPAAEGILLRIHPVNEGRGDRILGVRAISLQNENGPLVTSSATVP